MEEYHQSAHAVWDIKYHLVWNGRYAYSQTALTLFAVLIAAGVMSLAWMVLLTLVVFAEKVIPHGQRP